MGGHVTPMTEGIILNDIKLILVKYSRRVCIG
jgi:hypothetical protein